MELRKWLRQFPDTEELASLYQEWRRRYYLLEKYSLPRELVEFLHARKPENFKLQDEILRFLIAECKSDGSSDVTTIYLFIVLFPFIEIVFHYWRKQLFRYGIYDDEIWNEIWSGFCKVLSDYKLIENRDRVGLCFQSKLGDELQKWYRKIARQYKNETNFNDDIEISDQCNLQLRTNELSEEDITEMEHLLDELVTRGVIDPAGKTLVAETRLYKIPLQKTAEKLGLSYAAVQRQRLRIELKISKNLKKSEI